jgi:hypothetical protein
MAADKVARRGAVSQLADILDLPEIQKMIDDLRRTRWTGRPGYPIRTMVGFMLLKSLFLLPTWTRVVALVEEHVGLRELLDCIHDDDMPSIDAVYRFDKKLRVYPEVMERALGTVLGALRRQRDGMGEQLAIDGSDMPAYANGQAKTSANGRAREPEEFSDQDASWGHRSSVNNRSHGSYYGYKIHAAVCVKTDLPVAWQVESAAANETRFVDDLFGKAADRGFKVGVAVMDKGYDNNRIYEECETRKVLPVIPLRKDPPVTANRHIPPE